MTCLEVLRDVLFPLETVVFLLVIEFCLCEKIALLILLAILEVARI